MFVESTSSCIVDGLITVYAHTFLEEQTFLLTERRTQAEAKHSENEELSLETPDELPLGTADELPLEIPDGPSRSDRQAMGSDTPPRKKKKRQHSKDRLVIQRSLTVVGLGSMAALTQCVKIPSASFVLSARKRHLANTKGN